MEQSNPPVCERCGNRLALGLAIVRIHTIVETVEVKLCGMCQTYLRSWLKMRRNDPA